jgi:Arc/MetJ-type ribon-helix-helix transcriptional regulator
VKLNVSIPKVLVERIEEKIRRDGSATSVADYLRQAAVRDLAREGYGGMELNEGARRVLRETKAR